MECLNFIDFFSNFGFLSIFRFFVDFSKCCRFFEILSIFRNFVNFWFKIVTFSFVIFEWVATWIDPRDDSVKYSNDEITVFKKSVSNPHVIRNLYCQICKVAVESKTKHCRSCNKCVHHFDHHCDWLNNCVGEKNYK